MLSCQRLRASSRRRFCVQRDGLGKLENLSAWLGVKYQIRLSLPVFIAGTHCTASLTLAPLKKEALLKKIDFHIHTVPTVSDADFTFDLHVLKRYVSEAALDAIAITNHNVFDGAQFSQISDALDVAVFPGIEVSLDHGHILIISEPAHRDAFAEQAEQVSARVTEVGDGVSIDELTEVFRDLGQYLVIPHYDKGPAVRAEALQRISEHVSSGEVDSAKKFIRAIKDESKLTPVLFSDARISAELRTLPTRQTFVDCGEVTLPAIKACLQDKAKVALSHADGNSLFQVFEDGQALSTGLNVLLGERSSGKTYTLNKINASHERVKYIRQFSLVQQDEDAYEREFSRDVQKTRSQFAEEYLSGFRSVLDDVVNIDLRADEQAVEEYVASLIEAAKETDRRDAFSNTALFDESDFSIGDDEVLIQLIASVRQVIENVEFRAIVEKHVDITSLKQLAVELIEVLWARGQDGKKKKLVNGWVRDIKEVLRRRTSAVQVQDVDLYWMSLNRKKVARFSEMVTHLQAGANISEEQIQGFRVVVSKGRFESVGEVKSASGTKLSFRDAFRLYDQPYEYLRSLLAIETVDRSVLYRLFAKITYTIFNKDGYELSGGERSEFRLLQEIKDAQNHDMLLIDEPESSFDNMFLRSDVNQIIKEIAETMPVVVVTHNSTVGASVGANYLLYASKEVQPRGVVYRLYSGYPTDLRLRSPDGKTIGNHEVTLNSLEAGRVAYNGRRLTYETIEDNG